MSDEIDELRDKIESLETRIEQLEQSDGGNHTQTEETGLDHRDESVIAAVEELGKDPGPRGTLKLYKKKTDIRQHKTAKERAKTLREKEVFAEAVEA